MSEHGSTSSISVFAVLEWAMKYAPVANSYERLILMTYADYGDADGCNAYPSKNTVAEIVMCNPKTVSNTIKALVARGLMRQQQGPPPPSLANIPEEFRPKVYEVCLPYSFLGRPQIDGLNRIRAARASHGDRVNSRPLTAESRPDQDPPERVGRKTRSDKGKPNPKRSAKKKDAPAPDTTEPDTTGHNDTEPDTTEGGESHTPPSDRGEGGNKKPGGGGIRNPEGGVSHSPNPPLLTHPNNQDTRGSFACDSSESEGEGPSLSEDGSAVSDAPDEDPGLTESRWTAEDVREHLAESAKVSAPGAERMALRCEELTRWGLASDDVQVILQGLPRTRPEHAFMQRTATPEQAREALGGKQDQPGQREDVERVCERMAEAVVELGHIRPAITQKWRQSARLLLDKDHAPATGEDGKKYPKKITEDDVMWMIGWVVGHHFWGGRGNVLSVPKLRLQFSKMATQARDEYEQKRGGQSGAGRGGSGRWNATQDALAYGSTLEATLDLALRRSDPNGYGADRAAADRSGGLDAFLVRLYGAKGQWSERPSPERVEELFASVRSGGYSVPTQGAGADMIRPALSSVRSSGADSIEGQEPTIEPEPAPSMPELPKGLPI